MASPTIVRWAVSFSSATRRFPTGDEATISRLPRLASPASVPDRARMDQSPVPRAKNGPYFQFITPPSVPTFTGLPKRPDMDDGMVATSLSTSRRDSGVGKTLPTAAPAAITIPPRTPAAMMKASRESRIVLP